MHKAPKAQKPQPAVKVSIRSGQASPVAQVMWRRFWARLLAEATNSEGGNNGALLEDSTPNRAHDSEVNHKPNE